MGEESWALLLNPLGTDCIRPNSCLLPLILLVLLDLPTDLALLAVHHAAPAVLCVCRRAHAAWAGAACGGHEGEASGCAHSRHGARHRASAQHAGCAGGVRAWLVLWRGS